MIVLRSRIFELLIVIVVHHLGGTGRIQLPSAIVLKLHS